MEKQNARAPPDEDRGKCRQFKGIRMRKWGKWVSEIRMPKSQEKIWLGSYKTAEQAARAYDAAVYCLRGPAGKLNFPDSVPNIPGSASSLSRQQIQRAATKYAMGEIPSTSSPLHNNSEAREKQASPSGSSWISETDLSSSSQQISKEMDWELWDSLFDGNYSLNLEKLPSNGESSASASEFVPTWQQKQKNQG